MTNAPNSRCMVEAGTEYLSATFMSTFLCILSIHEVVFTIRGCHWEASYLPSLSRVVIKFLHRNKKKWEFGFVGAEHCGLMGGWLMCLALSTLWKGVIQQSACGTVRQSKTAIVISVALSMSWVLDNYSLTSVKWSSQHHLQIDLIKRQLFIHGHQLGRNMNLDLLRANP